MKKLLLLAAAAIVAAGTVQAKTADELRFYLNPGHGSYGPNDRPMPTIGHPNTGKLNAAGTSWIDTDTLGFYEGRGTLPRSMAIGQYLQKFGVKAENIVYSRLANGPWPFYADLNTDPNYSDKYVYTIVETQFNRNLTEICEEVEVGNFDMFISSHSNAATDGTSTNYPLTLYRGYDNGKTGDAGYNGNAVEGSYAMAKATWPTHWMNELDPTTHYDKNNPNIHGDINFYGSYSTRTSASSGNRYAGYLGVLKHGTPGYLLEGFFHTYQPARQRALNFDYDRQEGRREARGVGAYFGLTPPTTGDIMGFVKDMHEKLVHNLYKYAAGTDDQWLPLNGATVKLMQGDKEVASYTVDDQYNGIFVFEDVEPGEYTIVATAEGYKAQAEVATVTVTANETAYSKIFLENENYVPDEEVFYNYPDPVQPGYLKLADEFNFNQTPATFEIEGVVKDAVQLGDSTIILSNVDKVPHLYLIKSSTQEFIKELSTTGIQTEDRDNFYSNLNAITLTTDRKLVGVSLGENNFAGTLGQTYVYKWDDIDSDPVLWFSTKNAGNYNNANVGHAIAVNGVSNKSCEVLITAMTTGSTRNTRFVHVLLEEGNVATTYHDNNETVVTGAQTNYGEELHVVISPNDEQKIILGGMGKIVEYLPARASAGKPDAAAAKYLSDEFGATGTGFRCFKYAGHNLMITPYSENGVIKGIKLLDITGGIENAKLIKTENTDLVEGAEGAGKLKAAPILNGLTEYAASAVVDGADIDAYLVNKAELIKYTTKDAEQESVKGILATGLNSNGNENTDWTFKFDANSDAENAYLTFYDINSGEEVGSVPLTGVKEGANEFTIPSSELPGEVGQRMNWAVTLEGKTIPTIAKLNNPSDFTANRLGVVVDNSPESDYFGRFYTVNRIGSSNTGNGLNAYNPDWTKINASTISGEYTLGNPYRLATDQNGTVYMANWADGARSGVYKLNPATLSGDLEPFFVGTHASNGTITAANGDVICTSTPSVFIAGTGANTHMYCHLEDYSNDISQYNIGNEDGTIMETWDQGATRFWGVGGKLASTHGAVVGESETGGIWVVQNRSAGNNNAGVPSIMYVNNAGEIVYNSGTTDNPIHEHLTGTQYCAGAISPEGDVLVVNQPDGTLKFFDIAYDNDVPTLTWKYDYKHGCGNLLTQLNYDYAGNLFVGGETLAILSIPTEENVTLVPAKKNLWVRKGFTTAINDISGDGVKEVKSVRIYDVSGVQQRDYVRGVNIVVTEYSDGTTSSVKVMK